MLCGIQQGKDYSCILYVHHLQTISHERLKLRGKGKHVKKIKLNLESEINKEDIKWLFELVDEKAPF